MKKLVRYLLHLKLSQKLPRLPRMYSTEYDAREIDPYTANLMGMTATRCPQGVELLKRRYHVSDPRQLMHTLPLHRPKRPPRVMPLMRRAFGTTAYNPVKRYMPRARAKRGLG